MQPDSSPFIPLVLRAFPLDCETLARKTALALSTLVDPQYRVIGSTTVTVRGQAVHIPRRIHFVGKPDETFHPSATPFIQCLLTRSPNGYERQTSLRNILPLNHPWSIPFVVLLAGEYVVEIINEIISSLPLLDPAMYGGFARENTKLISLLEARATSYWDCYYRHSFADRRQYPGLKFLAQLEQWTR